MTGRWRQFLLAFAITGTGLLLAAAATIALVDPLGISPIRIVSSEVMPQTNRRYLIPGIVRSGRFDSYIVGTSTSASLDPRQASAAAGGRFASLALHGATPHEQAQVVRLIARQHGTRAVWWGLDGVWCQPAPHPAHNPETEFPEWLYDEQRWNDIGYSFSSGMLDLVRRKLERTVSSHGAGIRADGFENLLPPDASYDAAKARAAIYGGAPAGTRSAAAGGDQPSAREHAREATPPAVRTLADALAGLGNEVRVVLVLMPVHASLLAAGAEAQAALQACKRAVAGVAEARGAWLLDALAHNAWTVDDDNYWDALHFRDRVAQALIAGVAHILRGDAAPPTPLTLLVRPR